MGLLLFCPSPPPCPGPGEDGEGEGGMGEVKICVVILVEMAPLKLADIETVEDMMETQAGSFGVGHW